MTNHSEDAGSRLEHMSGIPVGYESRGTENFSSASSTQIAETQLASASQVPTAFAPPESLQSLHAPQPEDTVAFASFQQALLISAAAALALLRNVAAASFGLMLEAPPAQDTPPVGTPNASIAAADPAQAGVAAVLNMDNALAPTLGSQIGDASQPNATIANAVHGTVESTKAQRDRGVDALDKHTSSRGDEES